MIIQPNKNYLFVCRANVARSVYGARWFEQKASSLSIPVRVESAGIEADVYGQGVQLTRNHIEWANHIFVMEQWMKDEIDLFKPQARVYNLDIPDDFRPSVTDPEICSKMNCNEAVEYMNLANKIPYSFYMGRVLYEKILEARLEKVLV